MNLRNINLALVACIAIHTMSGVHAVAEDDPLEPLSRRVGTWVIKNTIKKAEWTPKEITTTGEETIEWTLDKKFIQGKAKIKTDDTKSLWMSNYDAEAKVYRNWYFDNKGAFPRGKSIGRWDAKKKTMNWEIEIAPGLEAKAQWKYVSEDKFEWSMTIHNDEGKLMFVVEGTQTRKK